MIYFSHRAHGLVGPSILNSVSRTPFNFINNYTRAGQLASFRGLTLGRKTSEVLKTVKAFQERVVRVFVEQILERQRIGISRAKPAGKYQDRKSVDDVII